MIKTFLILSRALFRKEPLTKIQELEKRMQRVYAELTLLMNKFKESNDWNYWEAYNEKYEEFKRVSDELHTAQLELENEESEA